MMNTASHTSGPWLSLDIGEIVSADDIEVVVATIDLATDFGEANAALITAAPEMLEALKFAGPLLEALHRQNSGHDAARIYQVIGLVTAAVAKAEGHPL